MPTHPENTSARPAEAHLLGAMSEGRGNYILGMEAAGQRELVESTSLPSEMAPDETDFLAAGFTFGPADLRDPLFRTATLPAGWRKEPTDHSMWSHVVDQHGRRRVEIFYKAAFYDRRAFMRLVDLGSYARELLAGGDQPVYDDTWCTPGELYDALALQRQDLAEAERSYAAISEDWAALVLDRVRKEIAAVDRLAAAVLADGDGGVVTRSKASPTFNPAYRVARCGDSSVHPPHVVEHGPDQPRNCPGKGVPASAPDATGAGQ